jgi:hypothetical protein
MKKTYRVSKVFADNFPSEIERTSKKIEKLNNFSHKIIKFFLLNKNEFTNGSKSCSDEFIFYSDHKL